jgi:hypothetical protein
MNPEQEIAALEAIITDYREMMIKFSEKMSQDLIAFTEKANELQSKVISPLFDAVTEMVTKNRYETDEALKQLSEKVVAQNDAIVRMERLLLGQMFKRNVGVPTMMAPNQPNPMPTEL